MAASSRPSVTTAATLIASGPTVDDEQSFDDFRTRSFAIKNATASDTVYLGGTSGVTSSTGFAWAAADGPLAVDLEPGEELWGIVTTTTQVIHVLQQGR